MSLTPKDAQTIFDQGFAPWVRALDLSITAISPTGATLEMPITPDLTRMGDVLSGQALAALADAHAEIARLREELEEAQAQTNSAADDRATSDSSISSSGSCCSDFANASSDL